MKTYPFPMYCGRPRISGLDAEREEGQRLIAEYGRSHPSMVLWKFDEPDRVYGQCNFKMNADDPSNLKFCDTISQVLNHDLPIFVSQYGLQTIIFTQEELATECQAHIARAGLRVTCCHTDGRVFGAKQYGPLELMAKAKRWFSA